MMNKTIDSVIESKDDAIKEIERVSKKLKEKYSRKSAINEKQMLRKASPVAKCFSVIFTIITIIITVFSFIVCISTFLNSSNKTPNCLLGRSALQVSSGSMTSEKIVIDGEEFSSGFNIGDKIAVCPVDPKTLKKGDKIAFYAWPENYLKYHSVSKHEITNQQNNPTKNKIELHHILGFHSKEITEAGRNGAMLTFHHITNIYEDENKKLWFKTQGSANASKDGWFISEEMILGIYDESSFGQAMLKTISFLGTGTGFYVFLLVPLVLIVAILLHSVILGLELSVLEMDVVEQKRKITDTICVKFKIGYRMDTKTKYKVLEQANEDQIKEYVALLWPDGEEPDAIKKYVTKRKIFLLPIKKLLKLNQICEERFNAGEDIKEIAKYYHTEKQKIKQEEKFLEEKLQKIHKMVKNQKKGRVAYV